MAPDQCILLILTPQLPQIRGRERPPPCSCGEPPGEPSAVTEADVRPEPPGRLSLMLGVEAFLTRTTQLLRRLSGSRAPKTARPRGQLSFHRRRSRAGPASSIFESARGSISILFPQLWGIWGPSANQTPPLGKKLFLESTVTDSSPPGCEAFIPLDMFSHSAQGSSELVPQLTGGPVKPGGPTGPCSPGNPGEPCVGGEKAVKMQTRRRGSRCL